MSLPYFERLGAAIEDAWVAADREEERFGAIARDVLATMPPLEHFDRGALIRHHLDPHRPARRELTPLGAFGQPAITVYYGRGFVVDVYFWVESLSAIHNHPFCGLFTLLEGFSVHSVYAFDEQESVGARTRIGTLRQTELDLVRPGDVRLFSLEAHPLIHSLIHVPRGSISMVVRTLRSEGYFRYFPPSLAIAMDERDETIARQVALLDTLRECGDPELADHLLAFLRHADLETSFHALSRLWPGCGDDLRATLLEVLRERHGDRADLIGPVMSRGSRWAEANGVREQLADTDERFVATALMLAEDRASLLELLRARHPDPVQRLHRWIDASGLFSGTDAALPHLAHAMVDGLDVDGIVARLRERFGDGVEAQRPAIARYTEQSIFAALVA
ncbi:MAG TPA: hypothetical protein RMH99_02555 [Sandaracinaceae bacterium LLY-WYZ-13_1]|nr:hypothetical protein [Sandaracinaceae bacterium LLY-WYZ-13_1]